VKKNDGQNGTGSAAYDLIKQAIFEGRFPPGERLVEQRVADAFDLSRTPVREAFRALEAEGLVVTERHRGAVVRNMSLAEIDDLYELRARLEAYGAELASARATDDDVAQMDEAIEGFNRLLKSRGVPSPDHVREFVHFNESFHTAIILSSRHPRLGQLVTRAVHVPMIYRSFERYHLDEFERSNTFHQLIRDAIVRGEADRASRLMTEHILQGRDVLFTDLPEDGSARDLLAGRLPRGDGGSNVEGAD